jgi:ribosomal protein L34
LSSKLIFLQTAPKLLEWHRTHTTHVGSNKWNLGYKVRVRTQEGESVVKWRQQNVGLGWSFHLSFCCRLVCRSQFASFLFWKSITFAWTALSNFQSIGSIPYFAYTTLLSFRPSGSDFFFYFSFFSLGIILLDYARVLRERKIITIHSGDMTLIHTAPVFESWKVCPW